MGRMLAVLAVAGLVGCGSGTALYEQGPGALGQAYYTPAAYAANAGTAAGDFLKIHAGAGVSAVWPSDKSLDNTYMLDITGQLDIAFGFSAEVSLGWKTYDYYDTTLTDNGELTLKPLYATALYCMGEGGAKIYIGGGLQWEITELKEISGASTDNNIGFHAVAGVSLSQGRFSLQVEARY
ncbi:MAG TPA: hypothetical protein ENN09_05760, partial [Planctomycetes bacterium]|nr:hypothetical protein [Planctomycetota bacterium]